MEKLQYADDNFTQDDFMRILGDMYSHKGFHINSELKLNEINCFIINGLLQYFGNTSCHYQAKISKEKTNIINSNT